MVIEPRSTRFQSANSSIGQVTLNPAHIDLRILALVVEVPLCALLELGHRKIGIKLGA